MLTTNVKQQINTARDILVGKIPDPKGQIDQITNALIYKFMDDQDRLALTLPNGKPSFFVNELKPYAWHKLFDTKLSNQDKANLYVEGIAKLSVCKHLPDLFQDIFKDAYLPFRAPDTIAMFLNEINKFDYHHSEDLGNAFEYLLSIMGSQGDAGQFRTPRNIIEFIVDAVDPSKDDHILDPACGTAGFLVEAYKHITKDKKLTPNEVQELAKHIHGVDIDPGMAKIARVNLYLHGFKTPLITEDDTLSDEKIWGKKYDVILANPPFMTPKGGIVPHDKFSVKSNRAEVLFTDYIAEHLKLAGRAGIVVPEGIIFQSGKAYKQLRKMLVDDNYLWGVVSLPAGVFNPYSGVKTSILLLDRERATKNKEILFFKVENDGFDLGAQRREISKNDLPDALETVKKWKNGEKVENSKAIYIEKSKIAKDDDYNLSIDRYCIATDYTKVKWQMVNFNDVVSTITPPVKIAKNDFGKVGSFPIIDQSQEEIAGWTNDENSLVKSEKPVVIFGDHTCAIKYTEKFFAQGADGIKILLTNDQLIPKFLYYVLKIKPVESDGYQRHFTKLKRYKIPLPPLEIQEQIVAELDGYAGIVAGAKQISQNWKTKIDIDPEWEHKDLGSLVNITTGKLNANAAVEGGQYPFFTCAKDAYSIDTYSFDTEALLLAGNNASADYDVKHYIGKFDAYQRTYVITIEDSSSILYSYLQIILEQKLPELKSKSIGNLTKYLTLGVIKDLDISYPGMEIQKEIIREIKTEREFVESAKKLIEIYEQKTKEVVNNLWSE